VAKTSVAMRRRANSRVAPCASKSYSSYTRYVLTLPSESNEDCCKNCQFSAAGTVCRASTGDCDPKETCSGSNATCPADVVAKDGTGCNGGLKCASGQCTSRDQQCQSVMGQISSSSNDTRSCDSSSCIITCQSPALGTDVCLRMQQNFLDGTPCEGDGVCKNGQCSGGSALGAVKNWIDSVCSSFILFLSAKVADWVVAQSNSHRRRLRCRRAIAVSHTLLLREQVPTEGRIEEFTTLCGAAASWVAAGAKLYATTADGVYARWTRRVRRVAVSAARAS
jgi:hypothetical protein